MSVFIILLVIGLTGLVFMAIPAFGGHHGAIGHHVPFTGHAHAAHAVHGHPPHTSNSNSGTYLGLIPSPRTLFSLLTFYGAFGNLFQQQFHLTVGLSALLAPLPAYLIERFVATPLWNFLLKFAAVPDSELQTLLLKEAESVTAFVNDKGMVKVVRDGREVQFLAHLATDQKGIAIPMGTKLRIEEVDAEKERLIVRLI